VLFVSLSEFLLFFISSSELLMLYCCLDVCRSQMLQKIIQMMIMPLHCKYAFDAVTLY